MKKTLYSGVVVGTGSKMCKAFWIYTCCILKIGQVQLMEGFSALKLSFTLRPLLLCEKTWEGESTWESRICPLAPARGWIMPAPARNSHLLPPEVHCWAHISKPCHQWDGSHQPAFPWLWQRRAHHLADPMLQHSRQLPTLSTPKISQGHLTGVTQKRFIIFTVCNHFAYSLNVSMMSCHLALFFTPCFPLLLSFVFPVTFPLNAS